MGRRTHREKDTADLDFDCHKASKTPPTLFGEALAADTCLSQGTFKLHLLQYVDDLLLAVPKGTAGEVPSPVGSTLHHRVQRVMEKGSDLQTGSQVPGVCHLKEHQVLGRERKQAICSIPWLNIKQEVVSSWVAKFCRTWILGFSEIAKLCLKPQQGLIRTHRVRTE